MIEEAKGKEKIQLSHTGRKKGKKVGRKEGIKEGNVEGQRKGKNKREERMVQFFKLNSEFMKSSF